MQPISIIIPCLNEERYIGALLSCLAWQTFQDFEAIIVDGGSEDKTQAAVDRALLAHPNLKGKVRFVVSDKKGVAHQRNYGVKHATHERLVFFDADVQIPHTFLEGALQEINEQKLDVATTVFEPISSRVDDKLLYSIGNLYIQANQLLRPVAMGFCIFSTKRIHEKLGGFDEEIKLGEDFDYVERASKLGVEFKVITKEKAHISIRRMKKEGRLTYYKKALLSELISLVKDKKEASEAIEYDFGGYNDASAPRKKK
jgi:glycosyltransferase involved in cell wall biosynthesis